MPQPNQRNPTNEDTRAFTINEITELRKALHPGARHQRKPISKYGSITLSVAIVVVALLIGWVVYLLLMRGY